MHAGRKSIEKAESSEIPGNNRLHSYGKESPDKRKKKGMMGSGRGGRLKTTVLKNT